MRVFKFDSGHGACYCIEDQAGRWWKGTWDGIKVFNPDSHTQLLVSMHLHCVLITMGGELQRPTIPWPCIPVEQTIQDLINNNAWRFVCPYEGRKNRRSGLIRLPLDQKHWKEFGWSEPGVWE